MTVFPSLYKIFPSLIKTYKIVKKKEKIIFRNNFKHYNFQKTNIYFFKLF